MGFPATLLAAREFTDPDLHPRFDELVWSHIDNFSGRNPVGRHFGFRAPPEIESVEYGWFQRYPGGIGRLRDAGFVTDGTAKNQHDPHHPEIGDVGSTEGWIQHNAPLKARGAHTTPIERLAGSSEMPRGIPLGDLAPGVRVDELGEVAGNDRTAGLLDRNRRSISPATCGRLRYPSPSHRRSAGLQHS